MMLDRIIKKSAIVDFFPYCLCHCLTGSKIYSYCYFVTDRAIHWACAGKINMAFSVYGSF